MGANQSSLPAQTQPPAAPEKGRFISFRTLLMVRTIVIFTALLAGAVLVFYVVVAPSIVRMTQEAIASTLRSAEISLDSATIDAIVAQFGADFDGAVRQNVRRSVVLTSLVFFAVSLALIWLTSTIAVRSLGRLTEAARQIAQGNYRQDLSALYDGSIRTELSELAEAIEESGRVHVREQVLIERVHRLEIEIDEAKAARQVSEIVDSEFFQDLKAKAKALRQERSTEEPAAESLKPPAQD